MSSRIIRASGFWNLGLALSLMDPPVYRALGVNLTQPVWGWLIAGFLLYTSATLILCSRDVKTFGGMILWEGLLRFLAAAILIPAGLFSGYGAMTALLGLGDLAWGVVFFVVVPRMTGMGALALLMGRRSESSE
jgi:hypothetical protein